jgi:hypothetical protein
MPDEALETWDVRHFALVAGHLGAFNGTYLAGTRSRPAVPC